jgi:uncharacterized membrane protein YraQ (UPF0718 family)
MAISAGCLISGLKMERYVEDWVSAVQISSAVAVDPVMTWEKRIYFGAQAARDTLVRIWLYVTAGIVTGALIHGYLPEGVLTSVMGRQVWWSIPAGILAGVPFYSNAAGAFPIVQALMEKGAAMGTVLAFMMSVSALSIPELIILRRVLKPRLIAVFVGILAVGILLVGLLFNAIL